MTVYGVAANDTQKVQTKLNEVKPNFSVVCTNPSPNRASVAAVRCVDTSGITECHEQSALFLFRFQEDGSGIRALSRRSQNGRVLWDRMRRLITRWLPSAYRLSSLSLRRMGVLT